MLSIDNSGIRDFCMNADNTLAAAVAFAISRVAYTSAPTVAFSGGGGSGAAGTAIINANGAVTGITITAPGTGYTTAPTVAFSGGGGGTGAAGTATIAGGGVTGVTMTDNGGSIITFTDNTVYGSGDARNVVDISVFDKHGNKTETQIPTGSTTKVLNIGYPGLNKAEGLDMIATVVSNLGKVKDGTVKDAYTSGNFTMEV